MSSTPLPSLEPSSAPPVRIDRRHIAGAAAFLGAAAVFSGHSTVGWIAFLVAGFIFAPLAGLITKAPSWVLVAMLSIGIIFTMHGGSAFIILGAAAFSSVYIATLTRAALEVSQRYLPGWLAMWANKRTNRTSKVETTPSALKQNTTPGPRRAL